MPDVLEFSQIVNSNIFGVEFADLESTGNHTLEFKMNTQTNGGITVLYAPNGTGKSSLCDALANEISSDNKKFVARYNGIEIRPEDNKIHVIKDQLSRNIIPGNTADYLVGADIRHEYELKRRISEGFSLAFNNIAKTLKAQFGISKIGDYLLTQIENTDALSYIRNIIPNRTRGRNIIQSEFIQFLTTTARATNPDDLDAGKWQFIINDCTQKQLIKKIYELQLDEIIPNVEVSDIEKNDDAIGIIKKYTEIHSCIVCDSIDFDAERLLQLKTANRRRIYDSLDANLKEILDTIINEPLLQILDPFEIRRSLMSFVSDGDIDAVRNLQNQLSDYMQYISNAILNVVLSCFDDTSMLEDYNEYIALLESQPEIDSEELLFIQEIISENIGPEITLTRDEENDHNFKLMLSGEEFLGVEREKLHLSTGEQNFISLAFELLLARHSEKEFVVLDDPVSSFDSVYKNKIAFCIIKFLENKKQIVLTHNTDLIRLLEVQQNGCYNLYLLVNVEGGNNGFIKVSNKEKELLLNLSKLIKLFQNQNNLLIPSILNEKDFLMAMIPFMRGYAHICKNGDEIYTQLSGVMHGYETAQVDITSIYEELFGYRFPTTQLVSTDDILHVDCSNIRILDEENYPLLAETLRQTLIYYYLRMKVEKELVDIFQVHINPAHPPMLNQLIQRTLGYRMTDADIDKKREYKVFFTSRKTLLNEFNHFEGNMNIFQPAIDIEAEALQREINSIESKLQQLRSDYANI